MKWTIAVDAQEWAYWKTAKENEKLRLLKTRYPDAYAQLTAHQKDVIAKLLNQPAYHFAEIVAMQFFARRYTVYYIEPSTLSGKRVNEGIRDVRSFLKPLLTAEQSRLLFSNGIIPRGGIPDLFIYKDAGEWGFVEVKSNLTRDSVKRNSTQMRVFPELVTHELPIGFVSVVLRTR